jgi:hypothetical protein
MRRIFFDLLEKNNGNHQRLDADGFSCSFPHGDDTNLRWYRFTVRKKLTGYDIDFIVSHRSAGKIIEHVLSDEAMENLPSDIKGKIINCINLFIFGDDD